MKEKDNGDKKPIDPLNPVSTNNVYTSGIVPTGEKCTHGAHGNTGPGYCVRCASAEKKSD